eukprot:m.60126 g.60126  ORF g.60126 m.60126 type:complete len:2354 (-) comp11801_c0_seq2:580-7641(-)
MRAVVLRLQPGKACKYMTFSGFAAVVFLILLASRGISPVLAAHLTRDASFSNLCAVDASQDSVLLQQAGTRSMNNSWTLVASTDQVVSFGCTDDQLDGQALEVQLTTTTQYAGAYQIIHLPAGQRLQLSAWVAIPRTVSSTAKVGVVFLVNCTSLTCTNETQDSTLRTFGDRTSRLNPHLFAQLEISNDGKWWVFLSHTFMLSRNTTFLLGFLATRGTPIWFDNIQVETAFEELPTFGGYPHWLNTYNTTVGRCPLGEIMTLGFGSYDSGRMPMTAWAGECVKVESDVEWTPKVVPATRQPILNGTLPSLSCPLDELSDDGYGYASYTMSGLGLEMVDGHMVQSIECTKIPGHRGTCTTVQNANPSSQRVQIPVGFNSLQATNIDGVFTVLICELLCPPGMIRVGWSCRNGTLTTIDTVVHNALDATDGTVAVTNVIAGTGQLGLDSAVIPVLTLSKGATKATWELEPPSPYSITFQHLLGMKTTSFRSFLSMRPVYAQKRDSDVPLAIVNASMQTCATHTANEPQFTVHIEPHDDEYMINVTATLDTSVSLHCLALTFELNGPALDTVFLQPLNVGFVAFDFTVPKAEISLEDYVNQNHEDLLTQPVDEPLVVLVDDTPPSFGRTCPHLVEAACHDNNEAIASWPPIWATDNTDVILWSTHESGSTFLKGITNVSVTARDASGNIAHCNFSVVVSPTTDHVIMVPEFSLVMPVPDRHVVKLSPGEFLEVFEMLAPPYKPKTVSLDQYSALCTSVVMPFGSDFELFQAASLSIRVGWDISFPNGTKVDIQDQQCLPSILTDHLAHELANKAAERIILGDDDWDSVLERLFIGAEQKSMFKPVSDLPQQCQVSGHQVRLEATVRLEPPMSGTAFEVCAIMPMVTHLLGNATIQSSSTGFVQLSAIINSPSNTALHLADHVAPFFLNCPSGQINATLTSNASTVAVKLPELVVQDSNDMTDVTVKGPHNYTQNFPVGRFNLSVVASDGFNNQRTCNYSVVVHDITPPTITCAASPTSQPADLVRFDTDASIAFLGFDPNSTVATFNASRLVQSYDNSGQAVLTSTPPLGTTLVAGTYNVVVTVTDTADLSATCAMNVIVSDLEPPKIKGLCGATITLLDREHDVLPPTINATDNLDSYEMLHIRWDFDYKSPAGRYNVTLCAADASANEQCCQVALIWGDEDAERLARSKRVTQGALHGTLLLLGATAAGIWFQQRSHRKKLAQQEQTLKYRGVNFDNIMALQNLKRSEAPREIDRDCVSIVSSLGRGAYGEVLKAILNESRLLGLPQYLVAVKTLHENASAQEQNALLGEAVVLAQLDHPHIVNLIGVVTVGAPIFVLLQYCENGSLLDFLRTFADTLEVQGCGQSHNYSDDSSSDDGSPRYIQTPRTTPVIGVGSLRTSQDQEFSKPMMAGTMAEEEDKDRSHQETVVQGSSLRRKSLAAISALFSPRASISSGQNSPLPRSSISQRLRGPFRGRKVSMIPELDSRTGSAMSMASPVCKSMSLGSPIEAKPDVRLSPVSSHVAAKQAMSLLCASDEDAVFHSDGASSDSSCLSFVDSSSADEESEDETQTTDGIIGTSKQFWKQARLSAQLRSQSMHAAQLPMQSHDVGNDAEQDTIEVSPKRGSHGASQPRSAPTSVASSRATVRSGSAQSSPLGLSRPRSRSSRKSQRKLGLRDNPTTHHRRCASLPANASGGKFSPAPCNPDDLTYAKLIMQQRKVLWAGDIAEACAYLQSVGVVHRDIAARNVMINSLFRAQLGDFGLARVETASEYISKGKSRIAVRWAAPEALTSQTYNEFTDVWSFGCTLYEMFSDCLLRPFHHIPQNAQVLEAVRCNTERLAVEDLHDDVCNDLIASCTEFLPEDRPAFATALQHLRTLYGELRTATPTAPLSHGQPDSLLKRVQGSIAPAMLPSAQKCFEDLEAFVQLIEKQKRLDGGYSTGLSSAQHSLARSANQSRSRSNTTSTVASNVSEAYGSGQPLQRPRSRSLRLMRSMRSSSVESQQRPRSSGGSARPSTTLSSGSRLKRLSQSEQALHRISSYSIAHGRAIARSTTFGGRSLERVMSDTRPPVPIRRPTSQGSRRSGSATSVGSASRKATADSSVLAASWRSVSLFKSTGQTMQDGSVHGDSCIVDVDGFGPESDEDSQWGVALHTPEPSELRHSATFTPNSEVQKALSPPPGGPQAYEHDYVMLVEPSSTSLHLLDQEHNRPEIHAPTNAVWLQPSSAIRNVPVRVEDHEEYKKPSMDLSDSHSLNSYQSSMGSFTSRHDAPMQYTSLHLHELPRHTSIPISTLGESGEWDVPLHFDAPSDAHCPHPSSVKPLVANVVSVARPFHLSTPSVRLSIRRGDEQSTLV